MFVKWGAELRSSYTCNEPRRVRDRGAVLAPGGRLPGTGGSQRCMWCQKLALQGCLDTQWFSSYGCARLPRSQRSLKLCFSAPP